VRITRSSIAGLIARSVPSSSLAFQFQGFISEYINVVDVLANIGKATDGISAVVIDLIVAKGTYANLASAQTALAGTVIYYELATPLTIDESQFAENGIVVDKILRSNNDFTEFFVQDYDLFAPTSIKYSLNLAQAVENSNEAIQGLRDLINSFDNDKWIAPTLINAFVNVGSGNSLAGYYKDPNGVVRLRGRLATGASGASPFTLPIGFRPSATKIFPIVSNGVFGTVSITSLGVVTLTGNSTYYALDSISFKAVVV